ncbi:MAG: hypothetical protein E6296_06470 [Anaerococcus vaginalis]|nr:hypothetical protein [Anaerococcus vaginalis]
MIKSNYKKLIPKSIGNLSVLKALNGTDLIWEKIKFKGVNLAMRGTVSFNGGWARELPLNVPLKLIVNGSGWGVEVTFSGKAQKPLYRNSIFMLKRNGVFAISNEEKIDISIVQTSEYPRYIFE